MIKAALPTNYDDGQPVYKKGYGIDNCFIFG